MEETKVLSNAPMKQKKRLNNAQRDNLAGLAFVSPWIIGFLVFGAFPMIYSLFLFLYLL